MADQKVTVKVKTKENAKGTKVKNSGNTNQTHTSSSGGTHGGSGSPI